MSTRIACLSGLTLLLVHCSVLAQPKPQTLTGPKGTVWAIAFSSDGKLVAAASDVSEKQSDGNKEVTTIKGAEVRVWDAKTGELKQTLTHKMQVADIAFSPDGKLIAGGAFKEILLWDAQTGELKKSLKDFDGSAKGLTFSADGKTLFSFNSWFGKAEIRLWNLESGKVEKNISDTEKAEFTGLAVSSDGKTLATSSRITEGGFSGRVKIWDLPAGTVRQTIADPKNWIDAVALAPDGKTVAAPVGFGVTVWDAQTGKVKREIKEFVSELRIVGDGKTLVGRINTVGGSDVKFINLDTGRTQKTIKVPHKGLGHLGVSSDGKTLALGSGDAGAGEVRLQATGK